MSRVIVKRDITKSLTAQGSGRPYHDYYYYYLLHIYSNAHCAHAAYTHARTRLATVKKKYEIIKRILLKDQLLTFSTDCDPSESIFVHKGNAPFSQIEQFLDGKILIMSMHSKQQSNFRLHLQKIVPTS